MDNITIDYMSIKIDILEKQIKYIKQMIMIQRGLTYFNIIVGIYDFYTIYHSPFSIFIILCTGFIICNAGWCIAQLFSLKRDLNEERQRLLWMLEFTDNEEYKNNLKLMQERKKYYEILCKAQEEHAYPNGFYHGNMQPGSASQEGGKL